MPLTPEEFEEWSERIISGALIVKTDDAKALRTSQRFALASIIMHLGPTESHKPDAYFIHSLRKGAANQVAHAVLCKIKEEQKAKEEAAKKVADDLALTAAKDAQSAVILTAESVEQEVATTP